MKRTLYALTIVIVSFIYSQDSTKQISINLPSGIDIDLKGKVEFEFVEDIVLIAGKGHEDYQILNDKVINFDDRKIAYKLLKEKNKSQ